jgi:hypothetical protein
VFGTVLLASMRRGGQVDIGASLLASRDKRLHSCSEISGCAAAHRYAPRFIAPRFIAPRFNAPRSNAPRGHRYLNFNAC